MKKQIFGAILLSAALAVGTAMPAFATGTVTDTTNKQGTVGSDSSYTISNVAGEGGETTVNISTVVTQINVSVPLEVGFYAETGGGTLGVPSDGVYKLKNAGATDIYVVNIATSGVDAAKWQTVSGTTSFDPTVAVSDVVYGKIKVGMTGTYTDAKTIYFSNDGTSTKDTTGKAKIPAKNGTTDGELEFNFAGTNSVLNTAMTDGADEVLTKIVYTVSINSKHDVEA